MVVKAIAYCKFVPILFDIHQYTCDQIVCMTEMLVAYELMYYTGYTLNTGYTLFL